MTESACAPPIAAAESCPETSASPIRLAPSLDLLMAEPLRQQFLAAIDARQPIEVIADAVERLSTPCAQVLVAAARAADAAGVPVVLQQPSPEFLAALEDLGVIDLLRCWLSATGDRAGS